MALLWSLAPGLAEAAKGSTNARRRCNVSCRCVSLRCVPCRCVPCSCTWRSCRLAARWQCAATQPTRGQQACLRLRPRRRPSVRHRLQRRPPWRRSPAAPTKAAALLNSASLCGIALLARSQPTNARSATRFPFWSLRRSAAPARVARRPRWSSRRATPFRRRPCAPRAGQTRSAKDSALPARLRQAPLAPRAADLEFAPKLCESRKSRSDFRKRRAIWRSRDAEGSEYDQRCRRVGHAVAIV